MINHKAIPKLLNFCLVTCAILYGCQPQANAKIKEFQSEIQSLNSDKEKNDFLFNLWHEDQKYRGGQEGEIITQFGYYSDQHKEYIQKWKKADNEVFLKLKTYLEIHGYPANSKNYHELALNAFPTIIGHNHNFKAQKELLPFMYRAYKDGSCSIDDVVWILGEMHESKHSGRRYEMKSDRFTTEQEFTELAKALKLDISL